MDKPEDDIQHKFEDSSLVERAPDAMTSEMESFSLEKLHHTISTGMAEIEL